MTNAPAAAVIARGRPLAMALAGGGARALAFLQGTPGCSRVLVDAFIPYSKSALDLFMGQPLDRHASPMAARAMAWSAWRKTVTRGFTDAAGISCAAALATDRERRGQDRAHFGWCDGLVCRAWSLVLDKGLGRAGQEEVVSNALLALAADPDGPALPPEDGPESPNPVSLVLEGKLPWARVEPDGLVRADTPPDLVVSGSFNPLHAGHAGLARAAEKITGRRAVFEITAANADKPPLAPGELCRRIRQFHGTGAVVVTRLATFSQKARAFPGAVFAVGFDTAKRILEERFYPESTGGLAGALDLVRARGCSFLVAGRAGATGAFQPFGDMAVPELARGLFRPIPESEFRLDISSSAIRGRGAGAAEA